MGKKNKKKRQIKNPNKIEKIGETFSHGVNENKFDSDNLIYFFIFPIFLVVMLFIIYFIPSIDKFSYLISFYSTENVIWFFIISFFFVILYLLFANILFADKFFGKINYYTTIWGTFHAFGFAFVIVYINSIGYLKIIDQPTFWIMLLIADIFIEGYPLVISYIYRKELFNYK